LFGRVEADERQHGFGESSGIFGRYDETIDTIFHRIAAADAVGRDDRLSHSHPFQQHAWHSFAVRRQYHSARTGNVWAHIVGITQVIDVLLLDPVLEFRFCNGGRIAFVGTPQHLKAYLWFGLFDDRGCLHKFPNALVAEQAADKEKHRGRGFYAGRRFEQFRIDAGAGYDNGFVGRHGLVLQKLTFVVVVEKNHAPDKTKGQAVQQKNEKTKEGRSRGRIALSFDAGDDRNAGQAGGQAAKNIGFYSVAHHQSGSFAPHQLYEFDKTAEVVPDRQPFSSKVLQRDKGNAFMGL